LKQSAKQRRATSNDFAIPPQGGRRGKYPIPDRAHAIEALAKVDAEGTPEEKRKVHAAVRKRYPDLAVGQRPETDRSEAGRPDAGRSDAGRLGEQSSFPAGQAQLPGQRRESGRTPSNTF
jgi:hypothetical protein